MRMMIIVIPHSHFGNIIIILTLELRRPESKWVSSFASFSQLYSQIAYLTRHNANPVSDEFSGS